MQTKRNIQIFAASMVLLLAASCQKDGVRTLNATFERFESDSKAFVDNDYYACWEDDDTVSVNGTPCAVTLASGSAQARSAQIVVPEELDGQALLAFYPADRISNMSAVGGTVDFPHIQTYVERNGHQVIDNPMAAYCPADGTELKFHNLGSLLQVTIPNNEDIKAIQVKGVDNQMLCGKARIKFDNNGNPRLTSCTDGFNSVTLHFPEAVRANGKSFYIVLPPNTNFETLTIAVLSNNGTSWSHHAMTSELGRVLPSNHIAGINYDLSHNDNDFLADWTIRYTATAELYIYPYDNFGGFVVANSFSNSKGVAVFDDIVTNIPFSAFYERTVLKGISLPETVTTIGYQAFKGDIYMNSISMPCVTYINQEAFMGCTSLRSIEMPHVETIHLFAFKNCTNLETVVMPVIQTLYAGVFQGCTNIAHVYSRSRVVEIIESASDGPFHDIPETAVLHLPSSYGTGGSWIAWFAWPGLTVYDYDD